MISPHSIFAPPLALTEYPGNGQIFKFNRRLPKDLQQNANPFLRRCSRAYGAPVSHENWRKRQSRLSGSISGSVSGSAFKNFDPDSDSNPDPDGLWFTLFSEQALNMQIDVYQACVLLLSFSLEFPIY
jgi:hypothetical protein